MASFDKGADIEPVLADRDVVLPDPNTDEDGFGVQILAGQPVPPDLVDAYEKAGGKRSKAESGPARNKAEAGPQTSK